MNLHIKAGLIVAGILAITASTVGVLHLALAYIPVEALPTIGMAIMMYILLHLMYSIVLDQVKAKAKIQELVDRKSK